MVSKAIAGNRRTLANALSFLLFLVIIKVEVKNLTIMDFGSGFFFARLCLSLNFFCYSPEGQLLGSKQCKKGPENALSL